MREESLKDDVGESHRVGCIIAPLQIWRPIVFSYTIYIQRMFIFQKRFIYSANCSLRCLVQSNGICVTFVSHLYFCRLKKKGDNQSANGNLATAQDTVQYSMFHLCFFLKQVDRDWATGNDMGLGGVCVCVCRLNGFYHVLYFAQMRFCRTLIHAFISYCYNASLLPLRCHKRTKQQPLFFFFQSLLFAHL